MEILEKIKYLDKYVDNKAQGRKSLLNVLMVFRPWSFIMTMISVIVGSILGLVLQDRFDPFLALLVLAGTIAIHAATNIINDLFDTAYGVDKPGAPTTLYRLHPLLDKILSPREIIYTSLILYSLAALIGLYFFTLRGWPVAVIAIIGIIASIEYTSEPLKYKYRGLGEIIVFIMWGPLMTLGAYYVQTGNWGGSGTVLLISVPLGIWVALVLLANNLKDVSYDYEMNIMTVPIWLGKEKALKLFAAMTYSVYLFSGLGFLLGLVSGWALLVLLSFPLAFRLVCSFNALPHFPNNAEPKTAGIFAVYGGLLIISLIATYVFSIT